MAYDTPNSRIILTLQNTGNAARVFEVAQDAAYPVAPGETRRRALRIAPGSSLTDSWNLAPADHWYDITVTVADNPAFSRRFAGHLETGQPSKTDPAIGAMRI
jgi:phospholipase C